ncbi:hypothetical protein M3Y99_01869600 [Aphelenchoides fujianensis]|nr:hypothetical protein M3Y99_01869600 [Aphelenchoides fujianensis]
MVTKLKIELLKTKLQHLFEDELTAFIVHEEALHEAYNSNALLANGSTLQAELASIGQTLAEFVTREFKEKYTHVPDALKPCFISVAHIRQAGNLALPAPPAAAAQPQAPPSQSVHAPQQPPASVPLQSPISPAAPLGAAFDAFGKPPGMTPPPGFGAHSGMSGQFRSGRESTNEEFGTHGYQVDFPSSVSSTRANSTVNFEPHNTSLENEFDQHVRMTNERPSIPPVAPASPAAFFQQNGGFGAQPRPASREQVERRQEKIIKQLDEHGLERDEYEERDATDVYGGLRSTNDGEPSAFRAVGGHELEPQFRSTPYGFEQPPLVDVDLPPARRAESNDAIPPPPGFSPVPQCGASFPPASLSNAYADAEIESVCLEPADDRRRSAVLPSPIPSERTIHPQFDERLRANGVQRSARPAPTAQCQLPFTVDTNKLYYRVVHSSIDNSAQVNAYRRELYDLYDRHDPDVFASLPESLHTLAEENDGYGMGTLIHCLQQLNARFPNGMRPKQLAKADCVMSYASRVVPYFGLSQNVMSMLDCVESGLIVAKQGRFHVRKDFLDLQLWHVPIGLTSNLFRMLFCYSTCSVQELVQQNSLLKDQDGHPVLVSEEDVIRQANCFPFLFEIAAQSNEQNSMRSAQIKLSDHVQKWRIVLDSRELSRMPVFCDCFECTNGAPPVVVHEYD